MRKIRPHDRMARLARAIAGAMLAGLLVGTGACGTPQNPADISTGEMFVEISDALNAIRQENAAMQAQLDSLREVVARQDTLLGRVAAAAGVPR